MLVLALGVILALIAVPALDGWMAESRLSSTANDLITQVQSAKLRAGESGEAQSVKVSGSGVSAWVLAPDGKKVEVDQIGIDGHGLVEPVSFRVAEGERYVVYRFDFLTGHARQQEASF